MCFGIASKGEVGDEGDPPECTVEFVFEIGQLHIVMVFVPGECHRVPDGRLSFHGGSQYTPRPMVRNIGLLLLTVLLSACGKGMMNSEDPPIGIEQHSRVMPGKEIIDARRGKELWFAVGVMEGVGGIPANGVVQSHVFEDGTSLINLQLNIEVPPDGFFYEGWLDRGSLEPMSLGHLRNPAGDVRHQRAFEPKEDLRPYANMFVTREADDGDPTLGMRVAEGVLKERKR